MKKIIRDRSTEENRKFWDSCEKIAQEVRTWPDWKRAGINVSQFRETPRSLDETAGNKTMISDKQIEEIKESEEHLMLKSDLFTLTGEAYSNLLSDQEIEDLKAKKKMIDNFVEEKRSNTFTERELTRLSFLASSMADAPNLSIRFLHLVMMNENSHLFQEVLISLHNLLILDWGNDNLSRQSLIKAAEVLSASKLENEKILGNTLAQAIDNYTK